MKNINDPLKKLHKFEGTLKSPNNLYLLYERFFEGLEITHFISSFYLPYTHPRKST
jgi:hypothetical protein